MKLIRVGVDISKSVFQVHGVDSKERTVWRVKLKRGSWLTVLAQKVDSGCEIGLEACAGAHHWARKLMASGYRVKLIAPQFVKPYVKSNKTDRNDAEAICEAMSRPSMRFVPVKSVEQQDIQAVHRVREELVVRRTAKVNQIRGLVGEYGLVAPRGIAKLRRALPQWLEELENGLSERFRRLLAGLWEDLHELDRRVSVLDGELKAIAKSNAQARRYLKLRGIGPVGATALVATLGDGKAFAKGREFSVSTGLTPRQHSTGGRERLLGISKRGDGYLRKILVHGARAVVRHCRGRDDPLSQWLNALLARKPVNVVVVALANKTARIAWALARYDTDYEPTFALDTSH